MIALNLILIAFVSTKHLSDAEVGEYVQSQDKYEKWQRQKIENNRMFVNNIDRAIEKRTFDK